MPTDFFYSRYPEPREDGSAYSDRNDDHEVFYHRIGTEQQSDVLIFGDSVNSQRFHTVSTTEDERFAVLYISDRGQGKDGNAVMVMDLTVPNASFQTIWDGFDDQLTVIGNVGDRLLVVTNRKRAQQPRRAHRREQPR